MATKTLSLNINLLHLLALLFYLLIYFKTKVKLNLSNAMGHEIASEYLLVNNIRFF